MDKYKIRLLANFIWENLKGTEVYKPKYQLALFSLLLKSNIEGEDLSNELIESNHNELKVFHNIRGAKSDYPYTNISNIKIQEVNELKLTGTFTLEKPDNKPEEINFVLKYDNIYNKRIQKLEEKYKKKYGEILKQEFEQLLIVIRDIFGVEVDMRYMACFDIIEAVKDLYKNNKDSVYKKFIETTIGAAIFYLPHGVDNWNGRISVEAIKNKINKKNPTKDHVLPRRKAASEILSVDFDLNNFVGEYKKKYAPFTYVSPDENKKLINYFNEYSSYDEALCSEDIKVVEGFENTRELNQFCNYLKEKNVEIQELNVDSISDYLMEFNNI